jgi:hypothetical protein
MPNQETSAHLTNDRCVYLMFPPHSILFNHVYKVAMISDALLIFLPLRTLRGLKNQPRLRARLQLIFTASALTTCASIVSGVFNLIKSQFGYMVVFEIEVRTNFSFLLINPSPLSSLLPRSSLAMMFITSFSLSTNLALGVSPGLQYPGPRWRLLQTL